ncbi:hypothetical protein EDD21DRAFT_446668 [Dissophora ornata]|nr:hypothetical protein EDD21DRAFT_446668 [Dissophora ornata]
MSRRTLPPSPSADVAETGSPQSFNVHEKRPVCRMRKSRVPRSEDTRDSSNGPSSSAQDTIDLLSDKELSPVKQGPVDKVAVYLSALKLSEATPGPSSSVQDTIDLPSDKELNPVKQGPVDEVAVHLSALKLSEATLGPRPDRWSPLAAQPDGSLEDIIDLLSDEELSPVKPVDKVAVYLPALKLSDATPGPRPDRWDPLAAQPDGSPAIPLPVLFIAHTEAQRKRT